MPEEVGQKIANAPIFTNVRRLVEYKCSAWTLDVLEDDNYRNRIIQTGAVIIIGGRPFGGFGEGVRNRIAWVLARYPELKSHIIFIPNHNIYTSPIIQQGTDFSMMLSYKDKEGGPTSPTNAGQNGAVPVTVLDGVMPERLGEIKKVDGRLVSPVGFIIQYEESQRNGETYPDKESFVRAIEEACAVYKTEEYGQRAYKSLKINMTLGSEIMQAAGLMRQWVSSFISEEKALPAEPKTSTVSSIEVLKSDHPINSILTYLLH
jgi:glucan phosphorylase